MKKIFLSTLMALLASSGIYAQHVGTHPRDTINRPAENYFYNTWVDSIDMIHPRENRHCRTHRRENSRCKTLAKHFYTDTPIKVIGAAAAICTAPDAASGENIMTESGFRPIWIFDASFDNWVEYLRLYKATSSGLVLLAEKDYNPLDTARCTKNFFNMGLDEIRLTHDSVQSMIVPVYEVFFDKPFIITDSFYVESTNYHCIVDSATVTLSGLDAMVQGFWIGNIEPENQCYPQLMYMRGDLEGWRTLDDQIFLFPIYDTTFSPIDTCKAVTDLTVTQDSTGAFVSWQGGEHNRKWQFAYGRADENPDDYTVFNATSQRFSLMYLTPGVEYAVRVRGNCFDDTTFSDWCDTIRFVRQGHTEGIATASQPHVSLSPNPAHDRVSIAADYDIRHVTIYDMQGHAVLDSKAQGASVTLDIHSLPAGTYLLNILTSHGLSTQKLAIDR